jgi:hypothetical protein
VKGPVHDALQEAGVVELIGPDHFFDSVKAAKKGRHPDGLPMFGSLGQLEPEHGHTEYEEGIDAAEVAGALKHGRSHDKR